MYQKLCNVCFWEALCRRFCWMKFKQRVNYGLQNAIKHPFLLRHQGNLLKKRLDFFFFYCNNISISCVTDGHVGLPTGSAVLVSRPSGQPFRVCPGGFLLFNSGG